MELFNIFIEMGFEQDLYDSEQRALDITLKIIEYYKKHGTYPLRKKLSTPPEIRKLAQWINKARIAKYDSKSSSNFYTSCEELAVLHGCSDMFNQIDREQLAIDICYEVVDYYKEHGKYPTDNIRSENAYVLKLARWLGKMKKGKRGDIINRKGTKYKLRFYNSLQAIADEAGMSDMFNPHDKELNALEACTAVIDYYSTHGKYPTKKSNSKLCRWLSRMKGHKQYGNSKDGILYESVIKMAEDAGLSNMFDRTDREAEVRVKCQSVIEHIIANGYPISVSNHSNPNRHIYIWLTSMRGAKRGTNASKFFPFIDDMAIEAGYPNMFNSNWIDDEPLQ